MCFLPNWGWIHLALTFFVQNILWFLETRLVLAARHNIIVENLKEEDIIFGKFDVGDDFLLVNHILLLGKYYIYSQKCEKGMPSLQGFIARTRRNNNIELYIARKIGTLNNKHLSKREKSINIMWSPYNWILYINIKISTFYQLRCWSAVIVFFFFFFFFFCYAFFLDFSLSWWDGFKHPSEVGWPASYEGSRTLQQSFSPREFLPVFLVRSHNQGRRPQLVPFLVMGLVPSK